jgi:hypothetical protein
MAVVATLMSDKGDFKPKLVRREKDEKVTHTN